MAIHTSEKIESTSGFEKVIDEASKHLALDVMQKYQYQFPQKSTIRELAANAVDSIKEREIAKLIISGRAKVEDYYITRDGDEYKSSNFNADYFDLKYLSNKKDVEIIYEESAIGRDKLIIKDEGVGLGGSRLEGYFKLNWSSKRNSKTAIGKFGMGAKAPLSTGIDSFRVSTRHNGKKFTFDVYSHKVDSVTEKFNINGNINPTHVFDNGYECYYEETTEVNGTEIILETKKHHRGLYTDAVRSQLLYMEGITYKIKNEGGYEQQIPTKANVIYEDDNIILSDNNQYSKPHIIINSVCYGYINFEELETENKNGNIGIKMQAENIDISPSRENVIWADKTREEVTLKFKEVQNIASKEVEKQLGEKDFGLWLVKCANVLTTGTSTNDILGRLSRVVDRAGLKPTYTVDKSVQYKSPKEMLYGISIRNVVAKADYNYRTNKTTSSITREDLDSWGRLANGLYFTTSQANNLKDRYISSVKGQFVLLTLPEVVDEETFRERHKPTGGVPNPVDVDVAWAEYVDRNAKNKKIIDLLLTSSLATDYDTIVVPDDFIKKLEATEKDVVDDATGVVKAVELTPAEKRKLDERVVVYYPKFEGYPVDKTKSDGTNYKTMFTWVKHEPRIKEVNAWENVVYAYSDEDEDLITTAWLVMKQVTPADKTPPWFMNANDASTSTLKIVRIARGLAKHFKQFTHVSKFYENVRDGKLEMHNMFVKWYTGKLISEGLDTVKFLSNFSAFNSDIADKYNELRAYQVANYVDLSTYHKQNLLGCGVETFNDITTLASKILTMQLLVNSDASADDIKTQSMTLFNQELDDAQAVDLDVYKKLMEVIEYATPLKNILSYVSPLLDSKLSIPYELESEVKDIMRNKGYDS